MFEYRLDDQFDLQLLETRHAGEFFELVKRNFARLNAWCPWLERVAAPESTREFLREKLLRYADGNGFTAGIFHIGRLSGVIALEYVDHPNRATEIGYWVDTKIEGHGTVFSACVAVISHAFNDLHLERIQIRCAVENTRSRSIPERLGFKHEGTLRQCERLTYRTVDLAIYGLLLSEWNLATSPQR
jgi:ribosomal-protein-serine acetyltransferase